LAFGALVVAAGCAKAAPEQTVLQAEDLSATTGTKFDKNEIADLGSFTDTLGLDADAVQAFLHQTPYKRATFLETYQSNGIRAVDALIAVGNKYRLNPLVFLVRLEMAQGLVGENFYPLPPSRVEYVFQCGCVKPDQCDPLLAGLDKQLDCLGRALRTSLDEIKANGVTAGGWGPSKASVSLDGQTVTPADESTAALYQYMPVVGTGKSGNWLFWNIWQKYATALDYEPPIDGQNGPVAWIGDACISDPQCDYQGGFCLVDTRAPNGLCSLDCSSGDCPSDPSKPQAFCASIKNNDGSTHAECLAVCNPTAPSACRSGYQCMADVPKGNGSGTSAVCFNP
jgi:hypothetical protein